MIVILDEPPAHFSNDFWPPGTLYWTATKSTQPVVANAGQCSSEWDRRMLALQFVSHWKAAFSLQFKPGVSTPNADSQELFVRLERFPAALG